MNKEEMLLEQAKAEIIQLRNSNANMSARLDMFDKLMLLFHTEPAFPRHGMGEDVVYQIDKAIEANKKTDNLSNVTL